MVMLVLFFNKPLHIDDALFLRMGDILPFSFIGQAEGRVEFLGQVYEQLSPYESTHPPLIPFYLKILSHLPQFETYPFLTYHIGFLLFPALTLFFARRYLRAKRIGPQWALFLTSSPLFFVNATNLMTDVAMTSLWIGTVVFASRFAELGHQRNAFLSALLMLLALLVSYQSVALIPLIGVYFLIQGTQLRGFVIVILVPVLLFTAYLLTVFMLTDFFPFVSSTIDYNIASEVQSGMGVKHYLHKTTATLINLGLGLAIPTPILLLSVNQRRLIEHVVFASVITFTIFHLGDKSAIFDAYTAPQTLILRVLMFIGLIWCFQVVAKSVDGFRLLVRDRRRASRMLLPTFWFLGVLLYNILFMPYSTARYVLPALPPALMLVFGHQLYRLSRWREACFIALGFAFSIFLARIDFQQARADYQLAQHLKTNVSDMSKLWFSDDAGLNRYLNKSGAHYLPRQQQSLDVGDYVLITRGLIHPDLRDSLSLVERWEYPPYAGLTLFETSCKAGFYRSLDGLLPVAPATFVRRAALYQVNYFLKNLSQAELVHLPNPNYFAQNTFQFPDGTSRSVMYMHPDAKVAFPIAPSEQFRLEGRALTDPGSWNREGDGVLFKLGYRTQGEYVDLWQAEINGKSKLQDRKGVAFNVVVPSSSDAIWFEVGPGSAGDYRYDTAGWADLVLTPFDTPMKD